jgi:UDP-glucose 4-epimerase
MIDGAPLSGRVVVVGGSGFLGSHVADCLSDAGYSVAIYDRVPSPWQRPNQEMILGDLLDEDKLRSAIAGARAVYNFAALADLNQALDRPADTVRVNILGNKVKRFIYASTVYVYSREGGFYRCSKQASENYVEEYERTYGQEYTILRYGSLYGPRSDQSNGLYKIVSHAMKHGVLRYEGNSEALREYIHVEDAARASVTALGDEFRNQSVVLTGQEPMRVVELLKMLAEILALPAVVECADSVQTGHYVRTPYAYEPKLGRKYTPPLHVDLGQGLLQLIEEVRRQL